MYYNYSPLASSHQKFIDQISSLFNYWAQVPETYNHEHQFALSKEIQRQKEVANSVLLIHLSKFYWDNVFDKDEKRENRLDNQQQQLELSNWKAKKHQGMPVNSYSMYYDGAKLGCGETVEMTKEKIKYPKNTTGHISRMGNKCPYKETNPPLFP
ncbi:hypothetical protein BDA99DRAFT_537059 [Phascolomyces articulosus]|uniref:Uncharacterized protein n=1 Tax=Phascolomyces articulosus TaxID=60185 RepID=A0AAD5K1D3_9FUNG|nr:hypothetical protein BDA99DRAFT_537059 [Phascolomyces articulosus]